MARQSTVERIAATDIEKLPADPELMQAAIRLPGGGISKINIATDLELAALGALQRTTFLRDEEMAVLPPDLLEAARAAVYDTAIEKMRTYVQSAGKA